MRELKLGLLCALTTIAGCDRDGERPAARAEAPAVEAPAPSEERAPDPAEPPTAPPAPPPASTAGECATMEACNAAAAGAEREGQHARAAPLYARACELGLAQACHRLGELYRDGRGVAPDDAQARALFERGCREGSTAACDALGH